MYRNPVMFIVEIGSILTTLIFIRDFGEQHEPGERVRRPGVALALVHGAVRQLRRGDGRRAGQGAGRNAAQDPRRDDGATCASPTGRSIEKASSALQVGDLCVVTAGEVIPGDGDIVEGIATVDESAITGESAPVIRESGGDRSAVTGGTRVLSDEIVVRITAKPGETFLDRMIALVEGADRQKTPERDRPHDPARRADDHLPARRRHAAAVRHLLGRRAERHRAHRPARVPHPDHHRRAAVVDRHRRDGPPRAAQRAGDVGPRRRSRRRRHDPAARQDRHDHLRVASGRRVHPGPRRRGRTSSPRRRWCRRSPTRRPRVARSCSWPSSSSRRPPVDDRGATLVPFTAQTRMSGMDLSNGRQVRKGAADSVRRFVEVSNEGGRQRAARVAPDRRAGVTRRRHAAGRDRQGGRRPSRGGSSASSA